MKQFSAPTIEEQSEGVDLPEGWTKVLLPEICALNPPKPPPDALWSSAPVTFVPMSAVDETLGAITRPQARPFSDVRKGYTAFQEEDVIMAKITPCMENGKAAVARNLQNKLGFGSTEFHVFRSNGTALPEYIYHYIRQKSYRHDAESKMTGSVGQKRVPVSFLEQTELPLPPLPEQRRIIALVEGALTRITIARGRLANVPTILKAFRQSVLAAACSGRLTEDWREENGVGESAKGLLARIDEGRGREIKTIREENLGDLADLPVHWDWATMGRVADIQGGIQKQPKRTPKKNAYPYLRVANVLRNRLDLSEIKEMELFAGELQTYSLRPNDLLIVEGNGSIGEIGRSALWTGEIQNCVHQNHIIRVRAYECVPEYLNIYWNSPIGIGRVVEVAVTTAGLYSLSTKKIAMLPVPVAPLEEQREIVRRVDSLFKLADKIEERVAAATKRADKLTQAILAKAFRGELVPTEAELARKERRSYEPASELLNRINLNVALEGQELGRRAKRSGKRR
jgi:type I restriction enzyme S subunit